MRYRMQKACKLITVAADISEASVGPRCYTGFYILTALLFSVPVGFGRRGACHRRQRASTGDQWLFQHPAA